MRQSITYYAWYTNNIMGQSVNDLGKKGDLHRKKDVGITNSKDEGNSDLRERLQGTVDNAGGGITETFQSFGMVLPSHFGMLKNYIPATLYN